MGDPQEPAPVCCDVTGPEAMKVSWPHVDWLMFPVSSRLHLLITAVWSESNVSTWANVALTLVLVLTDEPVVVGKYLILWVRKLVLLTSNLVTVSEATGSSLLAEVLTLACCSQPPFSSSLILELRRHLVSSLTDFQQNLRFRTSQ